MDNNVQSGIYKIENIVNGKIYIGSSNCIERRWSEHIKNLESNNHYNKHLQNSWNKYGKNCFNFSVIEYCQESELLNREQYYIDNLKVLDDSIGYNIAPHADKPFLSEYGKQRVKEVNSELFKGENSNFNKHSEKDVMHVIELLKNGDFSYEEISIKTGIPIGTIQSIRYKDSWKYLTHDIDFPEGIVMSKNNKQLNHQELLEIIQLILDGKTNLEIANMYQKNVGTINDIRIKKTHKELTKYIDFPILSKSDLSEYEIKQVIKMLLDGYQNDYISNLLNINTSTVCAIRNHRSYNKYTKNIVFPKGKNKRHEDFINKTNMVIEYKKEHPDATQIFMSKELGISPSSINRICKYIESLDEII